MRSPRTFSAHSHPLAALTVAILSTTAAAAAAPEKGKEPQTLREHFQAAATPAACALLDDPSIAGRLDGLLRPLAIGCGREAEFIGGVTQEDDGRAGEEGDSLAPDVPVSNPTQDTSGNALTQSETSLAFDPVDNVLCAAWNDSFHGVTQGTGFSGFARSTNNGLTWTDFGAVNPVAPFDVGDPSLVWRQADGHFYYAALHSNGGLGLWRSTDNCQDFAFVSQIATGSDDKEIMAADNNPSSPHFGNLYVAWTDFGSGATIHVVRSTNAGASWSAPMSISAAGEDVQGAWPVVAPNGDVYVAWIHWMSPGFPSGNIEVEIERSTDGGVSYAPVTFPMTNRVNPRDSAATGNCGRPALGGNIRYLPSPQLAIDGSGNLHAAYSYDPDAFNAGDESNVYYRRSTNGGTSWEPEILVNDDGGTTDQWFPSISVGAGGIVTIGYYSRQNDVAGNLLFDYYARTSFTNGASFSPSVRLSDASSTVILDPNLATCYHGDYDTQIHSVGQANYLWSDDRDPAGAAPASPNVYTEATPAGTDYLLVPDPASRTACTTAGSTTYDIDVLQFNGFTEPVDLSASSLPGAATAAFVPDPAPTPSTSVLTVGNLGSVATGSYTITVEGSSVPGGVAHSTQVGLEVFAAPPAVPTLTSPADGATDVPTAVTLVWTPAVDAVDYRVEVDDDGDFSSPHFDQVVTTTEASVSGLGADTRYFWRVSARNGCGPTPSTVFDFVTGLEYCVTPSLPIPDSNPAGVDSTLTIPAGDEIEDLDVRIGGTHTWVGDVVFRLTHVDTGTSVTFFDRPGVPATTFGCSGDDWPNVLGDDEGTDGAFETSCVNATPAYAPDGHYTGNNPLTAFDGEDLAGDWTLNVSDHAGGDAGTLVEWCLMPSVVDTMPFLDGFETGDTSRWSAVVD